MGTRGRQCRAIVRTLALTVSELRRHWWVLNEHPTYGYLHSSLLHPASVGFQGSSPSGQDPCFLFLTEVLCSALFQSDWSNLNILLFISHFHADPLSIQIPVSLKGHAYSHLLPEVFLLLARPQWSCPLLNLSWTNLSIPSSRNLAHTILYIIELFMYACLLYPKTIDCKLLEQKHHVCLSL